MINHLTEIKQEVNQMHPLLKVLLPKLPKILWCEYTHGQHELGADFVLSKIDETLSKNTYIGVIVKVGSITQGSLYKLKRQIEECDIERYEISGKQKIYIDEIWVITNGNISENAKRKIHSDYRSKKVEFIGGDLLSQFIDRYLPNYGVNIPLGVTNYLYELRTQTEEMDKRLSLVPLSYSMPYIEHDFYRIEPYGYALEKKKKRKKSRVKVNLRDLMERESFVLVEGGMGSGKSKLLRQLVLEFSSPQSFLESKLIPIMITFRNFIEEYDANFLKLIESVNDKINEISTVEDLKYLVLIDGFDEIYETIDKQVLMLNQMASEANSNNDLVVIVTSRFLSSISEKEIELSSGVRIEIASLTIKKTLLFLTELCKSINLKDRIIEDLKRSHLFKELPRSPIVAILLAKLFETNSKELPANMTELYQKYIELVLGRWDIDKGILSQKEYYASENVVLSIAQEMIESDLSFITLDRFYKIITEYLEPRHLEVSIDKIKDILVNRSGIFVQDLTTNHLYFSHRTFLEFFYAKLKLKNENLSIDDRIYSLYWINIYFFYIGLHKDCEELLKEIIQIRTINEPQRWLRLLNLSNFFMAGYASPYQIFEESLHEILLDAARLYNDILEKNIPDSPFASLSEIQLLWWFQFIMRDSYAYEFFLPALESATVLIDDSQEPDVIKIYALFFATVIGIDLGTNSALEFILTKYREKLPASIEIGLFKEAQPIVEQTKKFCHHNKWLSRRIRRMQQSYVNKLFNEPITRRIT